MGSPRITILYNNSRNHVQNNGDAEGDSNWKVLDPINDRISFVGPTVYDGDSNATKDVFKIPENGNEEVPKICVNDYAEGKWRRIYLAGSNADDGFGGNYRYAFGAFFDGTTASAPVLQAWDSTSHSSYNLAVLGSGDPSLSMLKAVSTTNSAPGDMWTGTPLAGDGPSNTIVLDSGSMERSKMIYWNMRLVVPSTAAPFKVLPILCIYFTYS